MFFADGQSIATRVYATVDALEILTRGITQCLYGTKGFLMSARKC